MQKSIKQARSEEVNANPKKNRHARRRHLRATGLADLGPNRLIEPKVAEQARQGSPVAKRIKASAIADHQKSL